MAVFLALFLNTHEAQFLLKGSGGGASWMSASHQERRLEEPSLALGLWTSVQGFFLHFGASGFVPEELLTD